MLAANDAGAAVEYGGMSGSPALAHHAQGHVRGQRLFADDVTIVVVDHQAVDVD